MLYVTINKSQRSFRCHTAIGINEGYSVLKRMGDLNQLISIRRGYKLSKLLKLLQMAYFGLH